MGLLTDRAAVVTGAARGIGFAIAQSFAAHGAAVLIGDVDGPAAEEAAAKLVSGGARSVGMACDVTAAADVDALVQRCVDEFGAIDVLVNNAGITRDASMPKMSLEDFTSVIDVHLRGAWLGTRAAGARMRAQGSGAIVNVSSISGKVGNFGQTNYSAAKAGIVGLTKAAAKELARKNVRVNAVAPGLIRTAMTEAMPQTAWDAKMAEIPMGRAGEPSEVAEVVTFLASDMASYLTGIVVEIAGGRHI
jgi:3-oxoacyl-[acyl-carrier protein] reductase